MSNERTTLVDPVEEESSCSALDHSDTDTAAPAIPTLLELYKEVVCRCLIAGNTTWPENAFLIDESVGPHEAANALRHLVARHLLKECGDAQGAASILEALTFNLAVAEDSDQKFFRLLSRYTANELAAIEPGRKEGWPGTIWPGSEANVISLVLWGDDYIARFNQYCAKSLAAEGNVPALKARGSVTLLIHTAARDVEKLRALPSVRRLGVRLRIWAVPDELLEVARGDNKYWLLGALQSIHLFYAARRGANFLPIFPDVIYSARYFESLIDLERRGEDAIFLSGFRASRQEIAGQLEQYVKRDAYSIPASKLIDLALKHIDPYLQECFIDPVHGLPRNRVLFAHRGDHIEIRAPHYNPALIRNSVIRQLSPRYLMTLDSEIDKVLPPTSLIHFRDTGDDYFATELVDDELAPPRTVGFEEYAGFFVEHANTTHLRFERSPYRIAIQPEWMPRAKQISSDELADCFGRICELVEGRLFLADRLERPNVVWCTLNKIGKLELRGLERQLVVAAKDAAEKQLVALAQQLNAECRFHELDGLLSAVLRAADPPALLVVLAGRCQNSLGLRREALTLYRRAEELDPNLPEVRVALAAFRDDAELLTDDEKSDLLRGFSLPRATNLETRRFLDRFAAPHLTTLYTNDDLIVFQRALTFLRDTRFLDSLVRSAEAGPTIDDRTWRAHILLWAARSALALKGDFVELGTFRGYFVGAITHYLDFGSLDREFYLYDSFEGLPDDAAVEDRLPTTYYASLKRRHSAPDIYDSVRLRFAGMPNVRIIRGKVPDTLAVTCPERIAWLHVELGSAIHETAALEFLWERIVAGGFIILGHYGFADFPRQTQAHDDFFRSKGLPIAELPTGQGLVIKTRAD